MHFNQEEGSHITAPTSSPETQLIMRDGVEDGVITQFKYLVAKVASDPQRVSNNRDDFNPDDIRFDRIQKTSLLPCPRGIPSLLVHAVRK
jgi:hypothetical protein